MSRRAKEIRELEIDEISLVDKGANQHAKTVIAKRHEEKDTMEQYFDGDGNLIDITSLAVGDVVYNKDGEAFEFTLEDDADDQDNEDEYEDVESEERELETVGKAFRRTPVAKSAPSLAESIRVELSKALTDGERDEIISKALGTVDQLAEIAKRAEVAAEQERQIRLEREYTEIAKNYNVPVPAETLGRVLMHIAEVLPYEEQVIIAKCLDAASAELFEEYGHRGGGDNVDILSQVDQIVDSTVSKSGLAREEAYVSVFEANPDAYDEYLAERQGR